MESILCEVDFSWEGWREEESWREDDVRDRRRTNKKKGANSLSTIIFIVMNRRMMRVNISL